MVRVLTFLHRGLGLISRAAVEFVVGSCPRCKVSF